MAGQHRIIPVSQCLLYIDPVLHLSNHTIFDISCQHIPGNSAFQFLADVYNAYMSIKSEILKRLYKGEICGELLARDLGVSRTAIWKNVKQLISEGFDVQAKSRGYVLFGPTPLCKEGVAHYLNSFWSVDVVDETPSTNDLAKIKGSEGCDRYAIIAKRQSKGRGRLQRPFFAPEGGIYLSVVIIYHDLYFVKKRF